MAPHFELLKMLYFQNQSFCRLLLDSVLLRLPPGLGCASEREYQAACGAPCILPTGTLAHPLPPQDHVICIGSSVCHLSVRPFVCPPSRRPSVSVTVGLSAVGCAGASPRLRLFSGCGERALLWLLSLAVLLLTQRRLCRRGARARGHAGLSSCDTWTQ